MISYTVWKKKDKATLFGGGVDESTKTCTDYQRDLSPDELVNGVRAEDLPEGFTDVEPASVQSLLR